MERRYWLMLLVLFMTCIFLAVGCIGPLFGTYECPTPSGNKIISKEPIKGKKGEYEWRFLGKDGKWKKAEDYHKAERLLFDEYGFPKETVIKTGEGPKKIVGWKLDKYDYDEDIQPGLYFTIEAKEGNYFGRYSSYQDALGALYSKYGFPSCFPSETLVVMENGIKPISEVQVGDRIMSLDEKGDVTLTNVVRTYEADNNHYYLINNKVKVTGLHRFLTSEGWKRAYELNIGDKIRTSRQDVFEKIISKERIVTKADIKVYNLQVAQGKNFIISADGHSTYVVHNTGNGGNGGQK